jgi:hypothetical protein
MFFVIHITSELTLLVHDGGCAPQLCRAAKVGELVPLLEAHEGNGNWGLTALLQYLRMTR